jgi:hypothetical protein
MRLKPRRVVDFELIRLNQLVLVSSKTQQNFLIQGRTGNDWIARESAFRRQRRIQKRSGAAARESASLPTCV